LHRLCNVLGKPLQVVALKTKVCWLIKLKASSAQHWQCLLRHLCRAEDTAACKNPQSWRKAVRLVTAELF